jgi:hypothetical protein
MARKSKLVFVNIMLPRTMKLELLVEAKKENRSLSNHLRILLSERKNEHGSEKENDKET